MKKFASITIAILMVVSVMLSSVVSISALTGLDFAQKGTLTLEKKDADTKEYVEGAVFTYYKVLALNDDGNSDGTFTVEDAFKNIITVDELVKTGKSNATGGLYKSTSELEAKIPALEAVADNAAVKGTFKETEAGKHSATGLDLGVYLVVETTVPTGYIKQSQSFLVSVPEWTGSEWDYSINALPKNKKVVINKEIGEAGSGVKADVYAIGQKVPYTVTVQLPNYGTKTVDGREVSLTSLLTQDEKDALQIEFKDDMTAGLTYNNDLVVTIENGENDVKLTADDCKVVDGKKQWTVSNRGFDVKFKWDSIDAYQGKYVTLKYSATINENAVVDNGANINKVQFTFSNSLDFKYNPPSTTILPPPPTTLEDEAKVFTYAMNLNKTFEGLSASEAGVDATVVTLQVMRKADKTALPVIQLADGTWAILDYKANDKIAANIKDGKYTSEDKEYEIKDSVHLDKDGKVLVKGLNDNIYYVEETVSAPGYSKLTTPLEIKLQEEIITGDDPAIGVKATNYEYTDSGVVERVLSSTRNTFDITINNVKKQFVLPTTGGLGLWMFTIAGGVLMAGAIILFTSLRKKSTCK